MSVPDPMTSVKAAGEAPRNASHVATESYRRLLPHVHHIREHLTRKTPRWLAAIVSLDDLLQDVWIRALRGLRTVNAESSEGVAAWLRTIANHTMLDAMKRVQRTKRGGGVVIRNAGSYEHSLSSCEALFARIAADRQTPSKDAASNEAQNAMWLALASLPIDQRNAIRMRYLEGRTPAEIAVLMHKTAFAVNGLLFRALRHLRAYMGEANRFFSSIGSIQGS